MKIVRLNQYLWNHNEKTIFDINKIALLPVFLNFLIGFFLCNYPKIEMIEKTIKKYMQLAIGNRVSM